MDQRELTYAEIMQIVEMFKASTELSEFHLKYGATELNLRKPGAEGASLNRFSSSSSSSSSPAPHVLPPTSVAEPPVASEPRETRAIETPLRVSARSFTIKSISVGTFYRAPAPGATPFVSVGQRVEPETTVAIIEVMKLMNAMQAGCSGVVSEILVKDAQSVEYDQPLMIVELD
jgi:acetyl-CoA carboxylase biotin carboxyl carrier protein